MLCAWVLLVVAPLGLTVWVVAVALAVVVVLLAIVVVRHLQWVRRDRLRERAGRELEPLFSRFLESGDHGRLAEELRPVFLHLDAAERPVAAVLVTDLMQRASLSQREVLRGELERAGIVELGERGTRRRSPWRRALACEALGKIGSELAVPALLERLQDRRPEVRMAAVRALGDISSDEAIPALSKAFLEGRAAPTNVVANALRRIGGESAPTFERGIAAEDPFVRISSCFGLAGLAGQYGAAAVSLARVLDSDPDVRVRAAAAAALGLVGGGGAPSELVGATTDADVLVRRSAVKALGSFDDPASGKTLVDRAEDDDRETALRAAEALVALARRPRAASEVGALLESSSSWAIEYARAVAEVSA